MTQTFVLYFTLSVNCHAKDKQPGIENAMEIVYQLLGDKTVMEFFFTKSTLIYIVEHNSNPKA
jgi:hypothetical protein